MKPQLFALRKKALVTNDGELMRRPVRILPTILVLIFVLNNTLSAQILQKLSGVAVSVDVQSRELRVLFEHPVTGEEILKIFQILPSTNFKNAKQLSDIKPKDPVSIDYKEEGPNKLEAVYIEVIPLKEVPFSKEALKKKTHFLR